MKIHLQGAVRQFPLPLIPFGLLFLSVFACRRGGGTEAPAPAMPAEFKDFSEFYERFHTDSLYQMAHIIFPLQGIPEKVDSATLAGNTFFWQEDSWTMHRPLEASDSDFQRTFIPYTEDLIVEKIVHRTGDYGMVRRWSKVDGEWYLIYYAAMNRLAREGEG